MINKLAKHCLQNKRIAFLKKDYFAIDKDSNGDGDFKIKTNRERITTKRFIKQEKKERMPIFKCSCGVEILVIPDLAAMNKAIKYHVGKHKRLTGFTIRYEFLVEKIIETLSECYSESEI